MFFSSTKYFIIQKNLLKEFGIETTLVLTELMQQEELKKNVKKEKTNYFLNSLNKISEETTLSKSKIKEAINKLYKLKFIDVIIKKETPENLHVKIFHANISNYIIKNHMITNQTSNHQKKLKHSILTKKKIFKKPTINELKEYFLKLGVEDESEIMFDFYESKGWKIGKNSMKCWKSATRNWARRSKNEKTNFPNYYDQKFEKDILSDQNKLSAYHNHLKKLGWHPSYAPTSGTTWKLKKNK